MNEEELFCKLFPEYVVNGKPLSPYFDLFESGYEQAENRFEELKKQLDWREKALAKTKRETKRIADRVNKDKRRLIRRKAELEQKLEQAEKDLADYQFNYPTIKELEKENAELKNERNAFKIYSDGAELDAINLNSQLTKAKEIIRSLYFVIQDRIDYKGNIPLEDEMYRAKQFLK